MSGNKILPSEDDRTIAEGILNGDTSSRSRFVDVYQPRLLKAAKAKILKDRLLRSMYSAEDLVQDFITEKIFAKESEMFGPVASGEKPLGSRVSGSFLNHCIDLNRRIRRSVRVGSQSVDEVDPASASGQIVETSSNYLEEIRSLMDSRLQAIRRSFVDSHRDKVRLKEILQLSERITLAEQIAKSFAYEDALPPSVDPAAMAAELMPWTAEDVGSPMEPPGRTLHEIWQHCANNLRAPPFRVDGQQIADVFEVYRNTYDKWVSRARMRVVDRQAYDKVATLFPHWPMRLREKSFTNLGNEIDT